MISQKITQTIHCAATVEFYSSLSNSVRTNVGGTRDLFRLTKKFLHKPRFTFVSTAYVHTPASKQHFEERPVLLARPASEIYTEICCDNPNFTKVNITFEIESKHIVHIIIIMISIHHPSP